MPKILLPIPEVTESISRPVVMEVVRRFFEITGLPKDTSVTFAGSALTVPQVGGTLDEHLNSEGWARFPHSQRLRIEVQESIPQDSTLTTAVLRPDQLTFFTDTALGVYMKPVYQRSEIRIQMELRTQDQPTALRWKNALQVNIARGRFENIHEITYHYPIPPEFIHILLEIHRLRELTLPLSEDMGEYIRRCMDPKFTTMVNPAGNHPTLAVTENQICTIGYFDFNTVVSQFDRTDQGGSWVTRFEYVFQYDQPNAAVMQYPIMIHNSVLTDGYRSNDPNYHWRDRHKTAGLSTGTFYNITDTTHIEMGGYEGLSVPFYDDWLPRYQPPSTIGLLRLMLAVNLDDPQEVLNLELLGDYSWDSVVLDYLRAAHVSLSIPGTSAFNLVRYEGEMPISIDDLVVDSDLNVRSTNPLNPRLQHHLNVYLNFNAAALPEPAKLLLTRHGEFCIRYLTALCPGMTKDGFTPTLTNGMITRKDFDRATQYVSSRQVGRTSMTQYVKSYVGNFVIAASGRD